jgi:hypothetical protein
MDLVMESTKTWGADLAAARVAQSVLASNLSTTGDVDLSVIALSSSAYKCRGRFRHVVAQQQMKEPGRQGAEAREEPGTVKQVLTLFRLPYTSRLNTFNLATVHPDRCARHPLRGRRDHKPEEFGDFFRLPVAADTGFLRNFFIASSTLILCAGAHFSKKERRRPVMTAPGTILLT